MGKECGLFLHDHTYHGPAHTQTHIMYTIVEYIVIHICLQGRKWTKMYLSSSVCYLYENSRVCEGIIEHGKHIGCGDNTWVVTPGSDQQPVIDL